MVTLNLTFFIELALFLVFLWVTHATVFRKVLRHLDERTRYVEDRHRQAQVDRDEASELESKYQAELAAARREASRTISKARREAVERRMKAISERKRALDEAVNRLHDELMGQLEEERRHYDELVPEVVEIMNEQLGIKRRVA